ncbi:MAG: DNA polymerase IV [Gammaproteobacteria bacterium]|nr:DNA polymerase IV [Gammaproteobacteria bacterium]
MTNVHWERAIVFIDMDAFFASIEQSDHPELLGKPIGITNGVMGTCFITSSYEARKYGVRTGMRIKQAQELCPSVIQVPARPYRYAEVSTNIMSALQMVTPDVEVFSVDEAFLDVTRCQKIYSSPTEAGKLAKQVVYDSSGITCSVGVSGDKTTAKHAAKKDKPNGLFAVPPWQSREYLSDVPVTELSGIAKGIGGFLNDRGVYVCGEMKYLPIGELAGRFGNLGRRIWYMAQGLDPDPIRQSVAAPKSIGHGKVMPPNTKNLTTIRMYFHHMAEKVAARLRKHEFEARYYFIGVLTDQGWLAKKMQTAMPTSDSQQIKKLVNIFLRNSWDKQGCFQVQITALDPKDQGHQLSLFGERDIRREQINLAMDKINQRYGEFTLAPANLLNRSEMPNVIAPAWKPFGHRKTV